MKKRTEDEDLLFLFLVLSFLLSFAAADDLFPFPDDDCDGYCCSGAGGDGYCCDLDDGQSYYCDDETMSYCNGCCDDFEDKKKNDDLLMNKNEIRSGRKGMRFEEDRNKIIMKIDTHERFEYQISFSQITTEIFDYIPLVILSLLLDVVVVGSLDFPFIK